MSITSGFHKNTQSSQDINHFTKIKTFYLVSLEFVVTKTGAISLCFGTTIVLTSLPNLTFTSIILDGSLGVSENVFIDELIYIK